MYMWPVASAAQVRLQVILSAHLTGDSIAPEVGDGKYGFVHYSGDTWAEEHSSVWLGFCGEGAVSVLFCENGGGGNRTRVRKSSATASTHAFPGKR